MPAEALVVAGLQVAVGGRVLCRVDALEAPAGAVTAVIGGSGAGKSTLGRALCGALDGPRWIAGTAALRGAGIRASAETQRGLAGRGVAWLPQDADAGLSPYTRVGAQLARSLRRAGRPHDRPALAASLRAVALPDDVLDTYPHALSGGMRRRAGLALALAAAPAFLVADEPGAGLDPPLVVAVHDLLADLATQGTGVLLLTHELAAVDRVARQVAVMAHGALVEVAPDLAALQGAAGRALRDAARRP